MFLKSPHYVNPQAQVWGIGFFSQLLWELPYKTREGDMRSQPPNKKITPKVQLGFLAKDPPVFLSKKLICFYFSKNCKLWPFSTFSGPLGRQKKLHNFRADIGQETMALSVLSPDK